MAYDSQRGVTVLFSGGTAADTWEWNGSTWNQRSVSGPSARYDAAMTYDSQRGVCVLVGGRNATNAYLGDTWEYDGQTWTQRSTSGPAPRYGTTLVYDPVYARTVLFGGVDSTGAVTGRYLADLWLWDGATWTSRARDGVDSRYYGASTYDSQRGAVVTFGGAAGTIGTGSFHTFGDTWEANLVSCVAPSILTQPVSQSTCRSGSAGFNVSASDPFGVHYQWQYSSQPGLWSTMTGRGWGLSCGAYLYCYPLHLPYTTVVITPCTGSPTTPQHFQLRCLVTDAGWCSSTPSAEFTYTICPADFNCSGGLDTQDIFDFLNGWFAGSPDADFDGNGLAVSDIFSYLNAWFAGCP
jgi:hypothetical protein